MTFLIVMMIGLIGMVLMALPGLHGRGHITAPAAHGGLRLGHGLQGRATHSGVARTGHSPVHSTTAKAGATSGQVVDRFQAVRLIPSPRAVFSVMTLLGAFGYALAGEFHFAPVWAWVLALFPACGIEYFAVRPLWNLMFQFQGQPCSSIETLIMNDAKAVTPFRNGRGLVALELDGRIVQFSASLDESQANMPVRVGDVVRIEEVNAAKQRVRVSLR